MGFIFLLIIIKQDIDFEDLFDKASTSLVQFQAVKDSAFQEFIKLGKDSLFTDTVVDFLVSKFDTKSSMKSHTLKNILKEIGEPAIKGIVNRIGYRGSDSESRSLKQSLWVLGEIGGEEIIEPAARFIDDNQWQVRSGAYTTLGKSKSQKILPYTIKGLNDSISYVRKSAYYAFSQIVTENEISHLIDGLDDEFYGVRYAAVEGLLNVGEKVYGPLISTIGENPLKDYFIFKTLSQLNLNMKEKGEIIKFLEEEDASIRLLIYECIKEKIVLDSLIIKEDNELLKNYIIQKASEIH
jgi:hypothetical protein